MPIYLKKKLKHVIKTVYEIQKKISRKHRNNGNFTKYYPFKTSCDSIFDSRFEQINCVKMT